MKETSDKKTEVGKTEHTEDKTPCGWKLELLALTGFCVSGVFFIVSGLRSGDAMTVIGSAVWIISCLCWMYPYTRYFK